MGWYWLAYSYRKTERYQPAVDAYRQFAELRPTEPDPYFGMGLSLEALGKKLRWQGVDSAPV